MLKKKQVVAIVSVALVCFLIGTSMASDGGNPWNRVWEEIYVLQSGMEWTHVEIETLHEDVQILDNSVVELQSKVNTLEARVEELEGQMLPQGFVSAPAYDSGWISIDEAVETVFTHNLETREVFVYLIGKDLDQGYEINQRWYGVDGTGGAFWYKLDSNNITIKRGSNSVTWDYVRVMIWRIQEPPT